MDRKILLSNIRTEADVLIAGGAVLKLRSAGIGDMLSQCINFFTVCEFINCQPYFILPEGKGRNELSSEQLFELFGFFEAGLIVRRSSEAERMPLSDAVTLFLDARGTDVRSFLFDNNCYGSDALKVLRKRPYYNLGSVYSSMREVLVQGSLYKLVVARRKESTDIRVALHLRLGDVAIVDMDLISHLLKVPDNNGRLMHVDGLFDVETVNESMRPGVIRRFRPMRTYELALIEVLEQHPTALVTLLSDGMSRLSESMLKQNRDLFLNPRISVWELEGELNRWFDTLVEKSGKCLVGERHGLLLESIIECLSSDVIISASPGLFGPLSKIMGTQNQFVYVVSQSKD